MSLCVCISAHLCFSMYFSWCTSCPALQPSWLSRMQSPCVVSIPASSKGTACSLLLELTGTLGCLIEWQLFHCVGVWQPPADFSCTLPPFRISFAGGATLWRTQMWLSALIKALNRAENGAATCFLVCSVTCEISGADHIHDFISSSTMAVPPTYSDLGKAAKDIFSKGYGEYWFSPKSKLLTVRNSWNRVCSDLVFHWV